MIKVALVDDHQLFRKSLSLLLSSFEGIEIMHDTNDGLAFLKFAETEVIDVVLLDIQMPILDGYEVCKRLKLINPEAKILIISQLTSKEAIHQIMECGANGFFTKNILNFLQVTIYLCIFATYLMFSSAKIRKVLQTCK